jgi:flagellar motor switch protein FliN
MDKEKTDRGDAGSLEHDHIFRIPVMLDIVLGSTRMAISDLMKLERNAVIPLDRKIGEPVDIVVNGRVIARGEIVVVDEDPSRLGVSLTEVVSAGRSVN